MVAGRPAFSAKNARDIRKQRERERERETRRTKAMNSARRRPGTDRECARGQRESGRGREQPAGLCTEAITFFGKSIICRKAENLRKLDEEK